MRIAICLFKYFPFGGLQRDFRAITEELISRGCQVDVYALEWSGELLPQVNLKILPFRGLTNHRRYLNFAQQFASELQLHDYDIIIGFNKMPFIDIYYAADPCYKAMSHRLKSFIYRLSPRYRYFLFLEKAVFGKLTKSKIFVIAEKQKNEIIEYYHPLPERFTLLPPWVTPDRIPPANVKELREHIRRQFGIKDDEYLVLTIGSGFKTKGVDRAIIAIASLPAQVKQKLHYLVIGQDKPSKFQHMAKRYAIADRVKFLGGRNDVPHFLFAADLLIHPAYAESAGIVIVEAIVAGLPSLITETCGYAEHVARAECGLIVPEPFEQDYLNAKLFEMLSANKEQRDFFRENAIDYAKKQNFFEMPKVAVDNIMQCQNELFCRRQNNVFMSLRMELFNKWRFQDAFAAIMQLQGKIYRELEGRKTLRFEHEGKGYFAKIHYGVGWREIFKNFLQLRVPVLGAKNEWLAVEKLEKLQVDTLKIVGFGSRGRNPAYLKSFIITEELPNTVSLEDYCKPWKDNKPSFSLKLALLKKVAHVAKTLHQNGVNHRDFYICHFLLQLNAAGFVDDLKKVRIYLIDLHRAQLRRKTPRRWLIKDIGSLYFSSMDIGLTRNDLFRFIKDYFGTDLHTIMADHTTLIKKIEKRGYELYQKAKSQKFVLLRGKLNESGVMG